MSLEQFAYRPLRNAPRLAPLITALGASFALQQIVAVFYSRGQLAFPDLFPNTSFQLFGATIQVLWVFMVALALLTFILGLHPHHPARQGDAGDRRGPGHGPADGHQRRHDHRPDLHHRLRPGRDRRGPGRHVPGPGQLLHGLHRRAQGVHRGLLGGIGNIGGAVLGAFLLGILETFGAAYLGGEWQDVFAFGVLILVLVFRPTGLLGERVAA